jgi:hypothetical protein
MAMYFQKIISGTERMKVINRHNLMKLHVIFHYVCYYDAWFICIAMVSYSKGWPATGIVTVITALQIFWQHYIARKTTGLGTLIFIFTLAGFIIDSIFVRVGFVFFYDNPWMPYWSPPWMISLWISFAVSFYTLMQPLSRRYFALGVLSFFTYPFVYYASLKLGAGLLPFGDMSVIIYGVVFAPLLPFCSYLYHRSQDALEIPALLQKHG